MKPHCTEDESCVNALFTRRTLLLLAKRDSLGLDAALEAYASRLFTKNRCKPRSQISILNFLWLTPEVLSLT